MILVMADITARSILLGRSPYEIDGGALIGRDPRKVTEAEWSLAGIAAEPIMDVIRAKCLDCSARQDAEIRKCVAINCALWPYRMGANPLRAKRSMTDEQRAAAGERLKQARAEKFHG
jgi:hypothetical protein